MERRLGPFTLRDGRPQGPAVPGDLLSNVRYAPLWLIPRVVLGWLALQAGWGALRAAPAMPVSADQVVALGLTLSGIALILGLFTAPAALVAGSLSAGMAIALSPAVSVLYLALVVVLLLTWRTAGWLGLDRWLLPLAGLTGRGGALVRRNSSDARR